jgi:transcriptional regulator with PAS, ATPase and Fis domain
MESEFFGYEKGAFTGAGGRKIGIFEAFDEGTVFLDEIGDLPLHMQVKLLRVLETGEFQRIGSTKTIKVNIRVISATNKDLDFETFKGHFRQDLYYRLNVITLKLPPLKERPDDIPLLAEYFLKRFNAQFRKNISGFDQRAKEMLKGYSWPGNIRELENIIERTAILCTGNIIDVESLPLSLKSGRESSVLGISDEQPDERLSIDSIEREHILKVLKKNNFHRLKTANELNISERTLYRKLKRYDING